MSDPLVYRPQDVDGMTLLALDPAPPGRIVEVVGDLAAADVVAVLVPGNAHDLGSYLTEGGGAAPRANGHALAAAVGRLAPDVACAVVVWVGYHCPRGVVAGARRRAALEGAPDLCRLTHVLPRSARVVLVGHSYGSLVCGVAAAAGARVDDLVAVASAGLGVRHVTGLRTTARVWALRATSDWVRLLPRGRIGGFGHGRQPTDRRFGATVVPAVDVHGHSGYYRAGSAGLDAIAAIVAGAPDARAVARTLRRATAATRDPQNAS